MPKVTTETLEAMRQNLLQDSQFRLNYLVLTISSCLIATFGLLSNSAAVIIGAMIIAPLMLPLRGLAFAALDGDAALLRSSLTSLIGATGIAILLSGTLGYIVGLPEFGSEVLSRTQPTLIDLGIAVTAGSISGFAKVRPQVSDALAGTAIAVALMPPLCVVGLTLSQGMWGFSWGAFLLYITNFLGITLACMLVFTSAGYIKSGKSRTVLRWALASTCVLIVPLGISFVQLVQQAQLQATLKKILLNRTVTVGQQVELIKTEVNWTAKPAIVYLNVNAKKPLTSKQVGLVEKFVEKEMKRPFKLVFRIRDIQEVHSSNNL